MRAKGQIATRDGSSRMGLRPRESRDGRPALQLELNLLRDAEGVVDLDAEIADGAFRASYVRGGAARLSDCPSSCNSEPALFGASSACRTPNYRDRRAQPIDGRCARIGVDAAASGNGSQTGADPFCHQGWTANSDSAPGLLGDFELNRSARLLLDYPPIGAPTTRSCSS
jgi:hypothetical protein